MSQAHILHIAQNLLSEIGEKEHMARYDNRESQGYGLVICNSEVVISEVNNNSILNNKQLITVISSDDALSLYAEDGRVFGRIFNEVQSRYANIAKSDD